MCSVMQFKYCITDIAITDIFFFWSSLPFSLQRNGLIMEKLDFYEIPLTVKAQVIKSNQIREGLW